MEARTESASIQIHRQQEFRVGFDLEQSALDQFHRFDHVHVREHLAQTINELELLGIEQQGLDGKDDQMIILMDVIKAQPIGT